jgi:hypothetical protein
VYLTVYIIFHYLLFLKDVLILTLYTLLDTSTLILDYKIDIIYFI